jgi:ABC-type transporter Mla subunit MlaD
MPHHPVRNRIIAGGFLLAAMAAAVAILVSLGGWESWFQEAAAQRVRFQAAPNVKKGSPVLLAGYPVGRVIDCYPKEDDRPIASRGPSSHMVEIVISVPAKYALRKTGARVTISQALVGQSAAINIENVGTGDAVPDSEHVMGRETSPFDDAARELGIGEKERKSVPEIVEDVRLIATNLKTDLPAIVDKVKAASDNLVAGTKKADEALTKINQVLDENRENVKAAIANAKSATEKVDKGAGEVVANVKTATEDVAAIVKENREDIRQTAQHLHSVTEKADKDIGDIVANVKQASADIKAAVADFKVISADGKALVATHRGNVAVMLQNFRETSEHLLALSKEVRRAPWRLFATPDKKEVESLNLYDSARAFASAATDLETCADTIQVMLDAKQKGVEVDPEILKGMLKRLQETFDKYQEAEKALLKEFERIK